MMQPVAISGAVEKPISSAPSIAAIATSRPVFSWPSVCTTIRERRSFLSSVCWVSARPISHGTPADDDRAQRRGAGAAVVAGDEHVVGVGLRDARGDRADADLGDELHRDLRLRVRAAQVVDELLEVLDRVDVVVRRRRDEAHAGRRVAHRADVLVDLVAGQLAALAGLGALGHLDLQLVGVDEVVRGDAEAARGDLLDRRAAQVAVGVGLEAPRVLPALAGVRAAAEAVHRDRERLVRLRRDRAERHRAGGEALDDLRRRLDLLERDRLAGPSRNCSRPRSVALRGRVLVDQSREYSSYLSWASPFDVADRVLQQRDRLRVPHVVLAVAAPGVDAADRQQVALGRAGSRARGGRAPPGRAPRCRCRRCATRCR